MSNLLTFLDVCYFDLRKRNSINISSVRHRRILRVTGGDVGKPISFPCQDRCRRTMSMWYRRGVQKSTIRFEQIGNFTSVTLYGGEKLKFSTVIVTGNESQDSWTFFTKTLVIDLTYSGRRCQQRMPNKKFQ